MKAKVRAYGKIKAQICEKIHPVKVEVTVLIPDNFSHG